MSKKQAQPRRSKYEALKAEHDAAMETLSDGRLYVMTDERDEDGMPVFVETPTSLSERADTAVASYTATIGLLEEDIAAWQKSSGQLYDLARRARAALDVTCRDGEDDEVELEDRQIIVADLGRFIAWYESLEDAGEE